MGLALLVCRNPFSLPALRQEAADGDFEAFACLYDRFAPTLMYLFVRRGADLTLAEDLTEKVFVCLWERRKGFRAESSFETYLWSIAKHTLSKEKRESHKREETGFKGHAVLKGDCHGELSEPEADLYLPEADLYLKELAAAIRQAKAKLTFEQRQTLAISSTTTL